MCGILGLLTTDTYALKGEAFLKDALLVSQVRGMHSTGLMQIGTSGDIGMFKKAVNASTFIDEADAKTILGKAGRSRVTVGHVRHATSGAKDVDENAHPFRITRADKSEIIGVHNGSFRDWKNKKNSKDIDVDSAWAFQMIADENADAFEYFNGPFALVWYDTRTPDVLYMARNKERPLNYFVTEDGKSMYFMSELGSLGWVAGRNEMKKKQEIGYRYLEPGLLYQFSLKEIGSFKSTEYPSYDPKTTIHVPSSVVHHRGNTRNMYDEHEWGGLDDPWDQSFRGGSHRPWRPHTPGYISGTDYGIERIERVLDGVKEALKQARNKANAPSKEETEAAVVSMDDLEKAIEEAIAEHAEKKDRPKALVLPLRSLSRPMFLGDTTGHHVSQAEKRLVQDMALYGQVVDFNGLLYDEDEKVVEGEATIFRNGKWETVEAQLRAVERNRKFLYTQGRYPQRVVISGYNNSPGRGLPPIFILNELNNAQRNLILVEAGKIAAAN